MPELPEVETIRRGLKEVICGKAITNFEKRDVKVIQFEPKEIIGAKIIDVERRAKILIFKLDNKKSILTHLKMTGQLIWEESAGGKDFQLKKSRVAGGHPSPDWVAKLPNVHTRSIFYFDDNSVLFFNDLRRFGYMKLYDTKDLDNLTELKKLGPEPFSDQFTVDYLMRKASKIPNRKIKQFITDQEIISGVGNIYVDEALFYAKISPLRLVKDIKLSEWGRIRESIVKALELGLKYGGSSEDTYVDAFGNQGTMNDHTNVYRHTGAYCPDGCDDTIKRITLGGRGTHYCPSCQK
ncbi:MAG: bifunctional DNA-formamidopyrimidine glycosylase/DNA-(apurinic or apyrimidinic site) lyase [Patescibacteria group bacterium]|jgi:formamidopyrimidine-DNA glycosylase